MNKVNGRPNKAQRCGRTWIETMLNCPRLQETLNRYGIGVNEVTYFAKSASQPVMASRTPASVSYFPVRTKSLLDQTQRQLQKLHKLTHDSPRRIERAENTRIRCDVVNSCSGKEEQPNEGDYRALLGELMGHERSVACIPGAKMNDRRAVPSGCERNNASKNTCLGIRRKKRAAVERAALLR